MEAYLMFTSKSLVFKMRYIVFSVKY